MIVYGHNSSRVRYWYRTDPFRSYLNQYRCIARLVLSLATFVAVLVGW